MGQNGDDTIHQTRDSEALQAAFGREGCPICNVVSEAMRLYMDSWQLDEVKELVRKHDYRFEDESQGEEMTSWRRAAELCAGNPNVSDCASR